MAAVSSLAAIPGGPLQFNFLHGTLDQNKEVHDLLAKWDDDMRTDWKGHHKHTIAGCTVAGCYYPPAPIVVVGNDTTVLDRFKVVIKDLRPELERHWQSPYQDVRRHLASIKTNVILVVKRELDALGISNPHFFEDKPLARLACTGYADETTRKTDPITIMMLSCARFDNKPGMTTQVLRRLKRLLGLNMDFILVDRFDPCIPTVDAQGRPCCTVDRLPPHQRVLEQLCCLLDQLYALIKCAVIGCPPAPGVLLLGRCPQQLHLKGQGNLDGYYAFPFTCPDFYGCLVGLELLVEYCGKLGVGAPHPAQLARCEEAAISLGFLLGCGLETSVCLARGDTVNSAAIRRKVASCLDEVVKRAVKGEIAIAALESPEWRRRVFRSMSNAEARREAREAAFIAALRAYMAKFKQLPHGKTEWTFNGTLFRLGDRLRDLRKWGTERSRARVQQAVLEVLGAGWAASVWEPVAQTHEIQTKLRLLIQYIQKHGKLPTQRTKVEFNGQKIKLGVWLNNLRIQPWAHLAVRPLVTAAVAMLLGREWAEKLWGKKHREAVRQLLVNVPALERFVREHQRLPEQREEVPDPLNEEDVLLLGMWLHNVRNGKNAEVKRAAVEAATRGCPEAGKQLQERFDTPVQKRKR